jgi:hypothetical protein
MIMQGSTPAIPPNTAKSPVNRGFLLSSLSQTLTHNFAPTLCVVADADLHSHAGAGERGDPESRPSSHALRSSWC